MTREQAKREIDSLDYYLQNHTDDYGEESHTAMMMAIKSLEQEPCEDCISRQAVIDMTGLSEWFDSSDSYNEFVIALSDLPPVTPQQKIGHWIDKFGGVYRCSCCREIISIDTEIEFPNGITYKYCPNCGSYNGGEK